MTTPLLDIRDLHAGYGKAEVLHGIDLHADAGQVITVEPGLYYPDIGGVRLEDVALVTRAGARNLTKCEKALEL